MRIQSLSTIDSEPISHNPAIKKKVMVRCGEAPNLVYFSRAYFAPGQIAGSHSHSDMSEVFFVESGAGVIRINDITYDLKPGTCIVVEPNERHEVVNNSSEELVLTYFGIFV